MKSFIQYLTEVTAPVNVRGLQSDIKKALSRLALKDVIPSEVSKALKSLEKKYSFSVSVKKTGELEIGETSIIGYYDIEDDELNYEYENNKPIELVLVFSSKEKKIAYTDDTISDLAKAIAETLGHELLHMSQARTRNFKIARVKDKYYKKVELKDSAAYLAADDEIEAHAFNIAGALLDTFQDKRKAITFLQRPKVGVLPEHHFDMYIQVFGLQHAVTKRLYKKILSYIDIRLKQK